MTRRRDCTCAGTAPGYPQHEYWCGQPERHGFPPLETVDVHLDGGPVEPFTSPAVDLMRAGIEEMQARIDANLPSNDPPQLHSVPTTGGDEQTEQRPSMYACMAANGVPEEYRTAATAGASEWMKIWLRPKAEWLLPPADEPDPDGAA